MRRSLLLGLGIAATTFAGCGGGGGSQAVPSVLANPAGGSSSTSSGQRANASVKISIPARSTSAGTRSPQYISASTQSMTFSILDGSGKATQLASFDLTPTSPGCSAVPAGGTQCVETLGAPQGTDTFQVVAYDQTGGKGNTLSTATVQASLTAGAANSIPLVMDGVAATAQVVTAMSSLPVGSSSSTTVAIQAKDAQGNTIVGPGAFAQPFTLAVSNDTWHTLSLSSTTIAKPGESVTLSYNGNSLVGATLNATASGVTTAPATVAGSGYNVTEFSAPDYGNVNCGTVASPQYGSGYIYPYSLAPMTTGNLAAEVYLRVWCGSFFRQQDGLAVVTPSGSTTVYMGDTPNPTVTPTPLPAPGTTPAPPAGVVIVHGMSTYVQEEPNDGYSTVASVGTKIYYSASFHQQVMINGNPGTAQDRGIIGVLDTATNTVTEKVLNSGPPAAIRIAPNGTAYFITANLYACQMFAGCSSYDPTTQTVSSTPNYEVGTLDANGTLTEQRFASVGIAPTSGTYPADMTLSPDGSSMYIADDGSSYRIIKLAVSGTSITSPQFADLAQVYPYAIAANNTNVLTVSGYEPSNNYYFSYVPAATMTSAVSQPFTAGPYLQSYSVAFADGSFWLADDSYGSVGRISGVGTATRMDYLANPLYSVQGAYMCGIAAAGGAVWAADCDYGGFMRIAYGAPSQNGIVGQSSVRTTAATRSLRSAPADVRHPHESLRQMVPLPALDPIF